MRTVFGSSSSIRLAIAVVALCGWSAPRTAWAEWPAFGRAIRLEDLGQWADAGVLQPPDIRNVGRLSVEAVRTAHRMLEEGHVQGKLVMSVGDQP
ncbi:MAG TPA: zinc-binding dehydrogenase [Candidatus Eisenbacteria bacterium]|jgi:hypothetical protein|nr:zinc-binding dehydrogenase [Candidatus Eisenbacteria bacterium]